MIMSYCRRCHARTKHRVSPYSKTSTSPYIEISCNQCGLFHLILRKNCPTDQLKTEEP